ncbi:MAG: hypothetical protein HON90_01900 [Halobacteriovoraceae bacterium]|jgi:hypothetical protein|nr:hypothetical protein [Halobacteriovoraceae bacterium]
MELFERDNGVKWYHAIHLFIKVLMILIGLGVLGFGYYFYIDGGKTADYCLVKEKLESLENIEILKVGFKDEKTVITKIFSSFQIKNGPVITVNDLSPNVFNELEITNLARVGDWGVVSLLVFPKKDNSNERLVFTNGIRLMQDKEFIQYSKNQKFQLKKFSDIILHSEKIEKYILSLPYLESSTLTLEDIDKYSRLVDVEFGFESKAIFLRWRVKTKELGNADKEYRQTPFTKLNISDDIIKKLIPRIPKRSTFQ